MKEEEMSAAKAKEEKAAAAAKAKEGKKYKVLAKHGKINYGDIVPLTAAQKKDLAGYFQEV